MKNLIFVFACLFSVSVFGQTVYTQDQVVFNNDSTLHLDKSNNLPITGLLKEYHDNGQLSSANNYTNGEKEGLCKWYHENGQLSEEGNYINGLAEGLYKWYHENGQLEFEVNYTNGELEGEVKCYDKSGNEIPCD